MNTTYSRKICISTNSTCNLNCIYCYEKEKKNIEFNVDEATTILNELLNEKTKYGTKIKLHGGEPFLSFSKIKHLCENIWKEPHLDYFHFHITTNGTLVHGGIQNWLHNHRDKVTVKLSLDGNKRSSDINRPHSFDLIDIPFFVNTWPDLRVNMTITPNTLPYISENVKYLHSVGIKHIISHFSLMTDWDACKLEKEFNLQLLDIVDFYLKNPELEPWRFFKSDIGLTLYDKKTCAPCNIGEMKAYDFQTRRYYPCHMCFPSIGGEKKSEELLNIDFKEREKLEDEHCLHCPFINLCATCYAENYITRGSVSRRDLSLCKYQKLIFAALFKYEYARILQLTNPTSDDVRKMLAIQKWHKEIELIADCNY